MYITQQLFLMQVQLVVKARSRADVGVAFGAIQELSSNSESQHHHMDRPQSAPTTRLESLRACRQVTSSAATFPASTRLQESTHTKRKLRPKSCFVSSTQVS